LPEHGEQVTTVVTSVTHDLPSKVWTELEYRYDTCPTMKDALAEHL